MTKTGVTRGVAIALLIGVAIDMLLVLAKLGGEAGFAAIAHDPGKFLFHIAFLPVAACYLVAHIPNDLIRPASAKLDAADWMIRSSALILFVFGTAYVIDDAREAYCERLAQPADIADETVGLQLLEVRAKWRRDPAVASKEHWKADNINALGTQAKRAYIQTLNGHRSTECGYAKYWQQASFRQRWAAFMTWTGVMAALAVFWVLLVHAFRRKRPSDQMLDMLLIVIALLTPWLAFRAYSERWFNFGELALTDYLPIPQVFALVSFAVGLIVAFYVDRTVKRWLVIIGTGVASLVGLLADLKSEWFRAAADIYAVLNAIQLASFNILAALFVIGLAWFLLGRGANGGPTTSAPPPTPDAPPAPGD